MKFFVAPIALMSENLNHKNLCWLVVSLLLSSCFGPKNMFLSGKVTPKGCFSVGANTSANLSTAGIVQSYKSAKEIGNNFTSNDSTLLNEQLNSLSKTAAAYSVDPISAGYDFYIRYGIAKRFDFGYRYNNGAHVFDGRFQFMGSTGNYLINDASAKENKWHGAFGFQHSSQNSAIPYDFFGIISKQINFNLSRRDLLFPVTFSFPFGPEEKFGAWSVGMAMAHSKIKYSFSPQKIYQLSSGIPEVLPSFDEEKTFLSWGVFTHAKVGYQFIYATFGASLYYQNFGTFKSINQTNFSFKGFTLVPNFGIVVISPSIYKTERKKE